MLSKAEATRLLDQLYTEALSRVVACRADLERVRQIIEGVKESLKVEDKNE